VSFSGQMRNAWDGYWFSPVDSSRMVLVRVFVGLLSAMLFGGLLWIAPKWFSDAGLFDTNAALFAAGQGSNATGAEFRWSMLFRFPGLARPLALLGLIASAILATGRLGHFPAWIAAICLACFHHRAPLLITRSEPILFASLMYLALSPWANYWRSVSLRLIAVHFFVWISFSLANMLAQECWWNGSAIGRLLYENWGVTSSSPWFSLAADTLGHIVLVSQLGILVCLIHPAGRRFGLWLTVVFAAVILVVLADWTYALTIIGVSLSAWKIPSSLSKRVVLSS
jgi:hypothetical protein